MASRKDFLKNSFKLFAGAASSAFDSKIPSILKNQNLPLFPPGAVEDYEEKCTGCGDCVPACPAEAIELHKFQREDKTLAVIKPWLKACEMCEEISCVKVCEPKALINESGNFPAIGKAELNKDGCLAYVGTYCTFCYDACPIRDTAIKLENNKPVIISENCTGCGMCKQVCVAPEQMGISVYPV